MSAWYADSRFTLGDGEHHFFRSENERNPWIRLQLNKRIIITSVTVHNPKTKTSNRLRNLEVRAGLRNDLTNQIIGIFFGPGKRGYAYVIRSPSHILAEFISFQSKINKTSLQIEGIVLNEEPIYS